MDQISRDRKRKIVTERREFDFQSVKERLLYIRTELSPISKTT